MDSRPVSAAVVARQVTALCMAVSGAMTESSRHGEEAMRDVVRAMYDPESDMGKLIHHREMELAAALMVWLEEREDAARVVMESLAAGLIGG